MAGGVTGMNSFRYNSTQLPPCPLCVAHCTGMPILLLCCGILFARLRYDGCLFIMHYLRALNKLNFQTERVSGGIARPGRGDRDWSEFDVGNYQVCRDSYIYICSQCM